MDLHDVEFSRIFPVALYVDRSANSPKLTLLIHQYLYTSGFNINGSYAKLEELGELDATDNVVLSILRQTNCSSSEKLTMDEVFSDFCSFPDPSESRFCDVSLSSTRTEVSGVYCYRPLKRQNAFRTRDFPLFRKRPGMKHYPVP
uniref:LisH domain-containing protein n=1 Tax=Trichuris muris TaxID=70415 RepID=A0A5S6QUT9_TRIMR